MSLNDKLYSSGQRVAAYAVEPLQVVTDRPSFFNRLFSPLMNAPAVIDVAMASAPAGSRTRGNNPIMVTPAPQVLRNGAATASGNNAPRRGY